MIVSSSGSSSSSSPSSLSFFTRNCSVFFESLTIIYRSWTCANFSKLNSFDSSWLARALIWSSIAYSSSCYSFIRSGSDSISASFYSRSFCSASSSMISSSKLLTSSSSSSSSIVPLSSLSSLGLSLWSLIRSSVIAVYGSTKKSSSLSVTS